MQKRFKGVICSAENVCFPLTLTYDGVEYPVVTQSQVTDGDYLVAFLDTDGTPSVVKPVTIKPKFCGDEPNNQRRKRIGDEPLIRVTHLRTDLTQQIPPYLDPASMYMAGMYLRTPEGVVYIPLKYTPYCKFMLGGITERTYVMRTKRTVESEMGNTFNLDLTAVVDPKGNLKVDGLPVNIIGIVFTGPVNFTPSMFVNLAKQPAAIAFHNLDSDEYEEVGSIAKYNGRDYIVTTPLNGPPILIIATNGKARETDAAFCTLINGKHITVLPTPELAPYSLI